MRRIVVVVAAVAALLMPISPSPTEAAEPEAQAAPDQVLIESPDPEWISYHAETNDSDHPRRGPAAPIEVLLTQPDGSTLPAVGWGDESNNGYETLDGYTVVQEADGTWVYASGRNADGKLDASSVKPDRIGKAPAGTSKGLRPTSSPAPLAPASPPGGTFSGTQPTLVILVDFANRSPVGTVAADWSARFFGAGASVADYYRQASYNALSLTPAGEGHGTANDGVVGWLRMAYSHPNTAGFTGPKNQQLAKDAILAADPYVDFAAFDTDGDARIESRELHVAVIVAGYETAYAGAAAMCGPSVWMHQWRIPTPPVVDGVSVGGSGLSDVSGYTQFGEWHCATGDSPGHAGTIGPLAHEIGHDLGWPDLYDTDSSSSGVGKWSVMGGGSWNRTGSNSEGTSPALPDAFLRSYQGWVTPQQVTGSLASVPIEAASGADSIKRLLPNSGGVDWSFGSSSGTGEYFLIENRQLAGYDAGLPGCGLLVWHIDETRTWTNSANANEARKLVDLEEADGLAHLDTRTNRGDAGDPYPGSSAKVLFDATSNPNSNLYSGTPSGAVVRVLDSGCNPIMYADLSGPATVPGAPTGVTVAPSLATAKITWKAPASNGGSQITGYTATASNASTTKSCTATGAATLTCTISGMVDGLYTATVKASNAVGASAASAASAQFRIDRTAPTATAPVVSLRTGVTVTSTAVPVSIAWTGADTGGSGIARYELAKSTDGGTVWTSVSTTLTASPYATSTAPGGTIRYRVRAIDRAGNAGAWMTGPVLNPRLVQETGPGLAYTGTWSSATSAAYSGGSLKHSSTAGASATYTFTGRSVALVTTKASTRGALRIYVDGSTTPVTVDCYAATTMYQAQVWQQTWATTGAHTVKLVVVGTSGRPRVDVDALAVTFTDTTAPAAPTVPATALRTGATVSGTTLPVSVSWTGADNAGGSGIARYELAKSTDGGTTWTTVSTSLTSPSAATTVTAAGTVQFRVHAFDRAGNVGAWTAAGPVLTPVLVQAATSYAGSWPTATSANYSGGSLRYASAAGASASYTFTGRSVALVTTRATSRGAVRIYVDGSATPVTVDTYAAATAYQVQVWAQTWAASGTHTVKIVVVGTSGRARVDLDAFSVVK